MSWAIFLATALAVGAPPSDTVVVAVDSVRHEITITAGPYDLPAMPPMDHRAMMPMPGRTHDIPVDQFDWPIEGWLRGFRLRVVDGQDRLVRREVVHHLIMVNFSRRQLVYHAAERLMGAGAETDDADVPKTVGVPMKPGMRLGVYVAWHNDTGRDLQGVYLKLTLLWTPKNQVPRPVSALPVYMDANLTIGGSNTFEVPPGRSSKAYEFTLAAGGRLLGVGGHLHDHGVEVRLEDTETGKVLVRVEAKRDSTGKVTKIGRRLFGVTGDGLKLNKGRRYRVVGVYDNTTSQPKPGVMAHMVGLFAPDNPADWPRINPKDQDYQRDLASLQVRVEPNGSVRLIR